MGPAGKKTSGHLVGFEICGLGLEYGLWVEFKDLGASQKTSVWGLHSGSSIGGKHKATCTKPYCKP